MTGTQGRSSVRAAVACVLTTAMMAALAPAVSQASPALPPGIAPAGSSSPSSELDVDQAAVQARATGKPVQATQATTATDTVIANPDGTVTLNRTAVPTRARVNGEWKDLNPKLVPHPDGGWTPMVSSAPLRISDGGSGPLAVMSSAGLSASIAAPMTLRTPTVDGATATYADVLPDVDLTVTARADGGFSQVFVVHSAKAAELDALKVLRLPTQLSGIALSADAAGNVVGKDRTGHAVLTSPAPIMWDSSAPVSRRTASTASTSQGPGADAQVAPVRAAVRPGHIELTPDTQLLTGDDTTYPVYIDPSFTWASAGGKFSGWATLPEEYPATNYWKSTPDPRGRMQVGHPGYQITSRTFINFGIPTSTLAGAVINSATLKLTQTWAYSCTATRVNLHAPSTTLSSSNARWNYWDGVSLGPVVDYTNAAYGYNTNCPANGVPFDVKDTIEANVAANKQTQTFALVAGNMSDKDYWKEFLETSPTLHITYNHKPSTPTGLTTSPKTTCAAATPTIVGAGDVSLYAPVNDRNGGHLGLTFKLWKSSAPGTMLVGTDPNLKYSASGTTAVQLVSRDRLTAAAGGAITEFSWRVQVTDYKLPSEWSTTCRFRFDPTRPGAPIVTPPADGTAKIGQSVSIAVTPQPDGTKPSRYTYQLNGGPYATVEADANGAASFPVTATRFTNTVTVTGKSPGGNIGDTAAVTFNAEPADPAVHSDYDGDGITDLITIGGAHNVAAGLWLAPGESDGKLAPAAVNVGSRGHGMFTGYGPHDFDGAQLLAGRFGGSPLQDFLVYYPSGTQAGRAVVLRGNGDGSTVLSQIPGTVVDMMPGTFWDETARDPLRLANAGHAAGNAYPDLLGIIGDASTGYYLTHHAAGIGATYDTVTSLPQQTTPTGGLDWNTWTITGAITATGTTLFLWQQSSGRLYAWHNLLFDATTSTLSFDQQHLSDGWNRGTPVTPYAADIDDNGTADVWAVGDQATAAATLIDAAGTMIAKPAERVLTGTHAWLLNDGTANGTNDGPVTGTDIAKDSIGSYPVTGSGNARWDAGDLFDPSIKFDGTNSMLTTTQPALSTTADYTVSAWVKPSTAAGTMLSQDGSNVSGFRISVGSDSSWRFSIPNSNVTNPVWTTAAGPPNSAPTGAWTHVSASYTRSTGVMNLHVNGKDVARAVHPSPWAATGIFRIGAHGHAGANPGGYFNGQIAEVHTFDQVVIYDDGNPNIRDFNGDNKTDLIGAHQDGRLLLYRGNGAGSFRPGYLTAGSGWNSHNLIFSPGDFDHDDHPDLISRKPDGTLWLYRGNGAGGWINGGSPTLLGSGWQRFKYVFSPGDFNGDSHPDVLAANATDGNLYLYRGNGSNGFISPGSPPPVVGSGWASFLRAVSPGDFSGDGHPDVLATKTDGDLVLYRGNGQGGWLNGTAPENVGTGWHNATAIATIGDFNGDRHPDIIRRNANGDLTLYRGNGRSGWINGGSPDKVGTGWNSFTKIM